MSTCFHLLRPVVLFRLLQGVAQGSCEFLDILAGVVEVTTVRGADGAGEIVDRIGRAVATWLWYQASSLSTSAYARPHTMGVVVSRLCRVVMSPLEFMQRLAALVPRPRLYLIRFHGELAPHTKLRAAIVPRPPEDASAHAADHAHAHGAPAYPATSFPASRSTLSCAGTTAKLYFAAEQDYLVVPAKFKSTHSSHELSSLIVYR